MKRITLLAVCVGLSLSLAACGSAGGGSAGGAAGLSASDFPVPSSVDNLTDTGDGSINFQTDLSVEDSIAFYRESFGKAGLSERTINTAITETTFSIVFDGDPSGRAIVVQGVDLGNGTTNINVRYEDV